MDFTLSTEWELYWVVYTQTETTAVKHIICPRMGSVADQPSMSGTGTVSIRCVKFEEGAVPTPWCPNSADTNYIGNAVGFQEVDDKKVRFAKAGYITANEFIEI